MAGGWGLDRGAYSETRTADVDFRLMGLALLATSVGAAIWLCLIKVLSCTTELDKDSRQKRPPSNLTLPNRYRDREAVKKTLLCSDWTRKLPPS